MRQISRLHFFIVSLFILGSMSACRHTSTKLLIAGSANDQIRILDKATQTVEWEYPLEEGWECNSVARTETGDILFSYGRGARMVDEAKRTLWDLPVSATEDLQTAQILPDGNILLAVAGHVARLIETDPEGKQIKEITFETGVKDPHFQFRRVIKNKAGNYMVPLFMRERVLEISPAGQVVNEFPVKGYPFAIRELQSGHYLVSCGDLHCFVEVDAQGQVIRKIGSEQIPQVTLQFVAEVVPDGDHFYICNWQGHEKENPAIFENPPLLEINSAGEVVWSLDKGNPIGYVSAVFPFVK